MEYSLMDIDGLQSMGTDRDSIHVIISRYILWDAMATQVYDGENDDR